MPAQVTSTRVLLLGTEPSTGVPVGVTTGTSRPINMAEHGVITFYLTSIGTIGGGTVLIEEADYADPGLPYSGVWSQITSITPSAFSGGGQQACHIADSAYGYVRVRISAAITGGGSLTVALRSRGAA